jgi:hypothetical protein
MSKFTIGDEVENAADEHEVGYGRRRVSNR